MFEQFVEIIKRNAVAGMLVIIGLVCVGLGITQLQNNQNTIDQNINKDIQIPQTVSNISITPSPNPDPSQEDFIAVDVQGAVNIPGVYTLSMPARISDALTKAGDIHSSADTLWIAKNINRAQKLKDGDKLYIPKKGEVKSAYTIYLMPTPDNTSIKNEQQFGFHPQSTTQAVSQTQPQDNSSIGQKISINKASISELDSLDGIGEVRAKQIIEGRPYKELDELVQKKIIYKSTYEKIKDDIEL